MKAISSTGKTVAVTRGWRRRLKWLALLGPTALAIVYFGFVASPRYVSEAQFVVRSASSARLSGLEALFRTFGISRAFDDTNVVQQYMLSRDAVAALEKRMPLREVLSRPEADTLSRYPRFWENQSFESLYSHYLDRVKVINDTNRGVVSLRIEAYRPEDAQAVASALMGLGEDIVNALNERARSDAVGFAQKEVLNAEERLIAAQLSLTEFRNQAALVDPSKNSTASLEMISKLATELNNAQAELLQTERGAPSSPALPVIRARVDALRSRIAAERAVMAGDEGSLAAKVSTYEKLNLMRELADKSYGSALLSLESARAEASRKQIYIERVAGPEQADSPTEPRRIRLIFMVFLVSAMGYAVFWILTVGAREHAQGKA